MATTKSAYAEAGVDIDRMERSLRRVGAMVKRTRTPGTISDIGSFGGMHKGVGKRNILVSSIDGVGTKLNVAHMAGQHDTVGQDLVNHCVNDILVQGARPLFFMDYLGTSNLDPKVFESVVSGLCKACKQNNCALIGGETAEMPGLYPQGEYDLVGAVVGSVDRKEVITGKRLRAGDVLIGLPSTGLHTNGYSLARKVIFEEAGLTVTSNFPGTRRTVAQVLLAVHKSYLDPVLKLSDHVKVHGLAHITGGGLVDNVPRILPGGIRAVIDRRAWKVPLLFRFLQEHGNVDREEMYRVFNMGIGMVVMVRKKDEEEALKRLKRVRQSARVIGYLERGKKGVRFLN